MEILFKRTKATLAKARETYGNEHQLSVCIEELNELSGVLTKYIRYDTHEKAVTELRDRVMDECGDVLNALDHIQAIFGIKDIEIVEAAAQKGDRVQEWLEDPSKSMEVSMKKREVPKKPCPLCMYNGADPFIHPCIICTTQPGYRGFTPRKDT